MDEQTAVLQRTTTNVEVSATTNVHKEPVALRERIDSVDALRGLAMFTILTTMSYFSFQPLGGALIWKALCNIVWANHWPHFIGRWILGVPKNGVGVSWVLVAQPMFVSIVGMVIPVAINKRVLRTGKTKTFLSIIKRTLILYLLGLICGGGILNLPLYHRTLAHIPFLDNILESISIAYFVGATLVLTTSKKIQYIVTPALLLSYWAFWLFVPAPGWHGYRYSTQMNIGLYVEQHLFGSHISEWLPWTGAVDEVGYIAMVLIGILIGHLIFGSRDKQDKVKLLAISGVGMIIVGEIWGLAFPIMFAFFTSSYVLVGVGISVLLLACFYLIIDVWGYSKWAYIFRLFGVNSIAIYVINHSTFDFRQIGNLVVGGISEQLVPPNVGDFMQAAAALVVMVLILHYMYTKGTFIKI